MYIWGNDEWKITFRTHYSHFKYMVMPFGLYQCIYYFSTLNKWYFHEYLDGLWFVTLITSSFFPRTWRNMHNMFDLFWTSSKKLNTTLSWKTMNSIKPKQNSLSILFLKMAFTWILVWSLNHCGLDYLRFYSWCSMFFGFVNFYQ